MTETKMSHLGKLGMAELKRKTILERRQYNDKMTSGVKIAL